MSLKDFGWECPKCGRIYAPHCVECSPCNTAPKVSEQKEAPELKAEEIIVPIAVGEEPSDEDVLYWATPYYDELQARKVLREEQLKMGDELSGNN